LSEGSKRFVVEITAFFAISDAKAIVCAFTATGMAVNLMNIFHYLLLDEKIVRGKPKECKVCITFTELHESRGMAMMSSY
jgi:hypothetical protein